MPSQKHAGRMQRLRHCGISIWSKPSRKGAPTLDIYTGTWSLYTVVIAVVMVLISLVLMVVVLVLAMLGRFRQNPAGDAADEAAEPEPGELDEPDDEPAFQLPGALLDDPDGLYDGFEPEIAQTAPAAAQTKADANALAAGFSAGAAPAAPKRKRRQTGLWQLIAALLACAPALMSAAWLDSIYGRLVTFTVGAGVNLFLLAAQVFLIVWVVRLQRRQ